MNKQNLVFAGNSNFQAPAVPRLEGHADYGVQESESGFDLLHVFWYVVHYRWLIAMIIACGLVAGTVFTWMQTPLYQAKTTLEVVNSGAKVLNDLDTVQQVSDMLTLETQRTKILSRDLARRVVFDLDLSNNSDFIAPVARFSLGNLVNKALGTTGTDSTADLSDEARQSMAVARIVDNLSARFIRGTAVVKIDYRHPDPKLAALVVNQVAQSFIDRDVDQRGEASDLARRFLQDQVAETKVRLEKSEGELVDYAQNEGILLDTDENSLIASNIKDVNNAISEVTQELFVSERYVQQIADGGAATLPDVFQSESIQAAKQSIAQLQATYQEKLATLKPAFPEMRQLRAQIDALRSQMNAEIGSIASSVKLKGEQLRQRRGVLQAELAKLEEKQADFQRKNVRYTVLKREVDSNRKQYESLIEKLNEVGVGSELRRTNAEVIDTAIPPHSPISPSLSKTLGIALVIAAALAALLVYVLELLNNTFSIPDQIETDLKLPVLGLIPAVATSEFEAAQSDENSAYSEAYRTLRTSIQFSSTDGNSRIFVVTSAEPSEGKSSSVYKLAEEFANIGKKVVVIDADLRRSKMHRFFRMDNTLGLTNLLTSVMTSNVETPIFRRTHNSNITFVGAGTLTPNPANLLASERMGVVLNFCAERYDLVLIDAPPVMGIADTIILSRYADATLMVVSAKQVKRSVARTALKRLSSASANVVGAVMTKFEVDKLDYNYAYRYMRYNYYSYGEDAPQITGPKHGTPGELAGSYGAFKRFFRKLSPSSDGST